MSDIGGQSARIFVGKLAKSCDVQALQNRFRKYGAISDVMVRSGFGFIQFMNEASAKAAIEAENNAEFMGKAMKVCLAKPREEVNEKQQEGRKQKSQGGFRTQKQPGPSHGWQQQSHEGSGRGQQQCNQQTDPCDDDYEEEEHNGPPGGGFQRNIIDQSAAPYSGGGYGQGGPFSGHRRGNTSGSGSGGYFTQDYGDYSNSNASYSGYIDEPPPDSRAAATTTGPAASTSAASTVTASAALKRSAPSGSGGGSDVGHPPTKKPCDAEIVCAHRSSAAYCESLESRLKKLGLNTDVLFPNVDIPLGRILANIVARGVRYAILVTPTNEQNRTATVNVLRGQQREHRNMPIHDAVNLIAKDFATVMATSGGLGENGRHPPDVMSVIGFLADHRPLSVMEYDKLIKYLVGKRELMLRMEFGETIPDHLAVPQIRPPMDPVQRAKEEDFKAKIVDFVTRYKEDKEQQRMQQPPVTAATAAAAALDPNVQKALDSLIKSGPNLFSKLSQQN